MNRSPDTYKSSEELQSMVAEGRGFALRVSQELATYAEKCLTRCGAGSDYLEIVAGTIPSESTAFREVARDIRAANAEFNASNTAAMLLLEPTKQVDANPSDPDYDWRTPAIAATGRILDLLDQRPHHTPVVYISQA